MKLIVGLGNHGQEYKDTRHNVGFMVVDNFAKKNNIIINKKKFNALYNELILDGEKFILIKPQTYMNLSGESVKQFVEYYNIEFENILIIYDDLDTILGNYRLRLSGSSGGHNGLNSIFNNLKTENIKRLKIGISNDRTQDTKDYVLGHFSLEEKKILDTIIEETIEILSDYSKVTFDKLMNKYNKRG